MKAYRFDNDLENLAKEISALVNMKKEWIQFHLSLLDFMKGVKTFNKKIENLVATGYILEKLFLIISEPLIIIKQKNNLESHQIIQKAIIETFGQYGTLIYKEKLIKECLDLPIIVWKENQINIESEPLLSLLLTAYLQNTKNMTSKKLMQKEVKKIQDVAQLLIKTEESLFLN